MKLQFFLFVVQFTEFRLCSEWSECIVTEVVSYLANTNGRDTSVISLKETLKEVYAEPRIQIQSHYHGHNFHYSDDFKQIHFKCKSLFETVLSYKGKDNYDCWMTPEYQKRFTCDGNIVGEVDCIYNPTEKQNGVSTVWNWTEAYIVDTCAEIFRSCGFYGNSACAESMQKYAEQYVKDKVGMVLGTQIPWLEGGLIAYGAKSVITVEYNPINSTFEKLTALRPFDVAEKYLSQNREQNRADQVDFIYTYSSLEHDGLGRYGDPMNPYADLESIARAHCLLKPGGIFFLGFGVGPDYVVNDHRIYGKLRLSMFLPMWEPIDLINNRFHLDDNLFRANYNNQPVWVLRKKNNIGEK